MVLIETIVSLNWRSGVSEDLVAYHLYIRQAANGDVAQTSRSNFDIKEAASLDADGSDDAQKGSTACHCCMVDTRHGR